MFESNVLKFVVKMNITNFNFFLLLIINIRIMFNFEKEWCTFDKKNVFENKIHPKF